MNLSKQDLLRALGSPDFMQGSMATGSDSDGDGDVVHHAGGHVPTQRQAAIDDLFKKWTNESKTGIVKVRSLGNALKDFQLIRTADSDSKSNTPSFSNFSHARRAMGESCFIFVVQLFLQVLSYCVLFCIIVCIDILCSMN